MFVCESCLNYDQYVSQYIKYIKVTVVSDQTLSSAAAAISRQFMPPQVAYLCSINNPAFSGSVFWHSSSTFMASCSNSLKQLEMNALSLHIICIMIQYQDGSVLRDQARTFYVKWFKPKCHTFRNLTSLNFIS